MLSSLTFADTTGFTGTSSPQRTCPLLWEPLPSAFFVSTTIRLLPSAAAIVTDTFSPGFPETVCLSTGDSTSTVTNSSSGITKEFIYSFGKVMFTVASSRPCGSGTISRSEHGPGTMADCSVTQTFKSFIEILQPVEISEFI